MTISSPFKPLAKSRDSLAQSLIDMEHAALVRWCRGDPSGFLDICADDVVYFDPFLERRIDGLAALTSYYESIRGQVSAERFEILNPHVHHGGKLAVLTFNFISFGSNETTLRWNCTEAYREDSDGWRIVQTHWSFSKTQT